MLKQTSELTSRQDDKTSPSRIDINIDGSGDEDEPTSDIEDKQQNLAIADLVEYVSENVTNLLTSNRSN